MGSLPTPTAQFGYTFDGWFDGDTRITPATVSHYTEPVTLTAKWLAPLAAGEITGKNGFAWAVYADGTLRFQPAKDEDGNEVSFTIADGMFQGMTEITAVELPKALTDIGNYAFADCTSLKSISVPGSVSVIRSSVFEGCIALESATLGSGIYVINEDAFRNCAALTEIALPLTVFQIYNPFEGCTALRSVRYEGSDFEWSVVIKDDGAKSTLTSPQITFTYHHTVK